MKKILILLLCTLVILLTACASKTDEQTTESDASAVKSTEAVEQADATEASAASADTTGLQWPEEFKAWGLPQLESGTLTVADNKSIANGVMTQGLVATVNVIDVAQEDFENYAQALLDAGLTKSPESLGEALSFYEAKTDTGLIKVTLSYSDKTVTILASNEGAAANKSSVPASVAKWPEAIKGVPVFSEGAYIETVDLGGNMFTITYKDVTESHIETYREDLLQAGFEKQEGQDTEGYFKTETKVSYSVGFILEGDTFQIIVVVGTL